MVTIRLARSGAKKKPFYRIVVTEHTKPRDNGSLEKIGYYNPFSEKDGFKIDIQKLNKWKSHGAQLSPKVKSLLKKNT